MKPSPWSTRYRSIAITGGGAAMISWRRCCVSVTRATPSCSSRRPVLNRRAARLWTQTIRTRLLTRGWSSKSCATPRSPTLRLAGPRARVLTRGWSSKSCATPRSPTLRLAGPRTRVLTSNSVRRPPPMHPVGWSTGEHAESGLRSRCTRRLCALASRWQCRLAFTAHCVQGRVCLCVGV